MQCCALAVQRCAHLPQQALADRSSVHHNDAGVPCKLQGC